MEIRAYVPAKKPQSQIIIRKKQDDSKKAAPVDKKRVVPKELKKAQPKVETKVEKLIKLRQNFIKVHKHEARFFQKITNIHPFIIHKAYEQSPWALELAIKYLDDPEKIHVQWFLFYLRSCYLAGEDYVRTRMSNGERLYDIVKQFGELTTEQKKAIAGERTEADLIVKFDGKANKCQKKQKHNLTQKSAPLLSA